MKYLEDLKDYKQHEHLCLVSLLRDSTFFDTQVRQNIDDYCPYGNCYKYNNLDKCDACKYNIQLLVFDKDLCLSGIEDMNEFLAEKIKELEE